MLMSSFTMVSLLRLQSPAFAGLDFVIDIGILIRSGVVIHYDTLIRVGIVLVFYWNWYWYWLRPSAFASVRWRWHVISSPLRLPSCIFPDIVHCQHSVLL